MSDVLNDDIEVPVLIGTATVHREIYVETAKLVKAEGLTLDVRNQGHWQISGKGVMVNYYPYSKNRTAHVDGTYSGVVHCTPWDAVQLALTPPDPKKVMKKWKKPGPKTVAVELDILQPDGSVETLYLNNQPTGVAPWE